MLDAESGERFDGRFMAWWLRQYSEMRFRDERADGG